MRRLRRPARIGAWAMLVVAAASLLLAGVGVVGVSWCAPYGEGFALGPGVLHIGCRGPGFRTNWAGAPVRSDAGWAFGAASRKERQLGVGSAGWLSIEQPACWFGNATILRGGGVTRAGARIGPGSVLAVYVWIRLLPVAGVAAALGGILWFVSKRRLRPGACTACGYDLTGLAPETACPECGHGVPDGVKVIAA